MFYQDGASKIRNPIVASSQQPKVVLPPREENMAEQMYLKE
jgi:hypothetical protein